MSQKALLIGSDYGGLRGVAKDLAVMEEALQARGFMPLVCGPEKATRAGILAEYEKLIANARPEDAVVVYYTGHGGFTEPSGTAAHGPTELQYIVPVDFCKSTEDDFRGIASAELSVLQAHLTAVTRNVTVVLDCCHSGLMSRDSSVVVKAVGPTPHAWVRAHLDRLERDVLRTDLVANEGSPHAVRIVACAPEQRAYEYQGTGGEWTGVLTESLALALSEAGSEPVTWADVVDRVRHRVVGLGFGQRPEAEGPSERLLFSTEAAGLLHSLPVTAVDQPGRLRLECAPLLRVHNGDRFAIMPPGSTRLEPGDRIGDLVIDSVSAMSAAGQVTFAPGRCEVPLGARAFRTTAAAPCITVKVPTGDPLSGGVLEALEKATLARPAQSGEDDWAAQVRIDPDGGLTLCDRIGPLHPPYRPDQQGFEDLERAVRVFAQGTELRRLVGDPSHPLDADVSVEWGLVVDGTPRPLAAEGAVLAPGQHIYVKVSNHAAIPVYVSLLDIGLSGRITLVTRGTPSGRLLAPGRDLTLGYHETSQTLLGIPLSWPHSLDRAHARQETILVVLTSEPQSLLALQHPEIAQARCAKGGDGLSRLQNIVDQIATGETRDIEADRSTGVQYDLRAIDFEMTPEHTDSRAPVQEGSQRR
ncbi:caspase family protein [Jatrophihabitans sp.]|jgi:hypothetical protein|uniref:caspase family protein n=1 Tax=Jatrophihabitans sp. TaxID=1932789 RepID=UPI002EE94895